MNVILIFNILTSIRIGNFIRIDLCKYSHKKKIFNNNLKIKLSDYTFILICNYSDKMCYIPHSIYYGYNIVTLNLDKCQGFVDFPARKIV